MIIAKKSLYVKKENSSVLKWKYRINILSIFIFYNIKACIKQNIIMKNNQFFINYLISAALLTGIVVVKNSYASPQQKELEEVLKAIHGHPNTTTITDVINAINQERLNCNTPLRYNDTSLANSTLHEAFWAPNPATVTALVTACLKH